MLIEPLSDSGDALHVLVNQLWNERETALEKIRVLTERNDKLWHLLKQLRDAQFGRRSDQLDRDRTQLAPEDLETAVAKQQAEKEKNDAAKAWQDLRQERARSGVTIVGRCRRICPASTSRSNRRAPCAPVVIARCIS
jgi:transposase